MITWRCECGEVITSHNTDIQVLKIASHQARHRIDANWHDLLPATIPAVSPMVGRRLLRNYDTLELTADDRAFLRECAICAN